MRASQRTKLLECSRTRLDPDQTPVAGPAAVLRNRLRDDRRGRVRRGVDHLGPGVLMLTGPGKGNGQDLAMGSRLHQPDRRVLHRQLGAEVAVDPFHGGVRIGGGPLGHQVVDVVRPVLDRGVAAAAAPLHDDLDDCRVERVGGVDRCRATFDVVTEGALVNDDQRPLELTHVLGVDAEIGLERLVDMDPRRDVDEAATGPHRRVQGGELVVVGRDDRAKYSLTRSGYSRSAVSMSEKRTPSLSRSSRLR